MSDLSNPRAGEEVVLLESHDVVQEPLLQYAWASGDNNPIHFDAKVAERAGLSAPIAHGMYLFGHAGLLIEEKLAPYFQVELLESKFLQPVALGSRIRVTGKFLRTTREAPREWSFAFTVRLLDERNTLCAMGSAQLLRLTAG